jgi:RimJ/RimL family protein N-acetyltransferase
VLRQEIGFFAECEGKACGSIWATINKDAKPSVVRGHIKLKPGEALIHDIVTGEQFRGMGIGPYMVQQISTFLLRECGVSKIIIDVNSSNQPSLRMMAKAGLPVKERVLYISAFGSFVWQKVLQDYTHA